MRAKDDGGTAFPVIETDPNCGTRTWFGMSLRDYFAAKALPEVIRLFAATEPDWNCKSWATESYVIADAMLEARDQ